jgi:hypothetical protein
MPYDGVSAIPEETPEYSTRPVNQLMPRLYNEAPTRPCSNTSAMVLWISRYPSLTPGTRPTLAWFLARASSVLIPFDVVSNRQLALINVHLYISGPSAKCFISTERNTSLRRVARRHLHALNRQVLTTKSGHLRFLLWIFGRLHPSCPQRCSSSMTLPPA